MQLHMEILSGKDKGQNRLLKDLEIIKVGRNPESDLPLNDLGISFDHAEIRMRNGSYWVVDRGSTNGTYLNGERAYNSKLREGDVVKFGKKGPELRYRSRPPASKTKSGVIERPKLNPVSGVRAKPQALEAAPALDKKASSESESGSYGGRAVDPNLIFAPTKKSSSAISILLGGLAFIAFGLTITFMVLWLNASNELSAKDTKITKLNATIKQKDQQLNTEIRVFKDKLDNTQERLESYRQNVSRLERKRQEADSNYREKERRLLAQIEESRIQANKLKANLDRRLNSNDVSDRVKFQQIQERYDQSVVFVFTHLLGKLPNGKTVNLSGTGTGFIVTRQGHIVTNKHVVQPWKFSKLALRIAKEKITVDKDSYYVAVWQTGQRFWDKSRRRFNLNTGYSTKFGTLGEYSTADDVWVTLSRPNGPREIKVHSPNSSNDIMILKVRGNHRFKPVVPFGVNDLPLRRLDQVMVLGFPLGVSILESEVAATSQSTGAISKIQSSIWIDGSLHPGNSGGPVFNSAGRVIGISTRIVGSENIGACIKIQHALRLLGGTW